MSRRIALAASLLLTLTALALAVPGAAEERAAFNDARDALLAADFDTMPVDARDRLFEALGRFDDAEAVRGYADIASRFGTWVSALESKQADLQDRIRPFTDRTALTAQETGVRNSLTRKIDAVEKDARSASKSMDLLAKVLGSYREEKTVSAAISTFPKHPTWRVRELFVRAAPSWHQLLGDSGVSRRLFAALKTLERDAEPRVRMAVARSLAAFKRSEALDLLGKCLKDDDWRVRAAAVEGLRNAPSDEAVGLLIGAMQKEEGRLVEDIDTALQELTGKKFAFPDMWQKWWESVGEKVPPKQAGEESGTASTERKFEDTDRFYGIPTRSDRILYIIDISGSMNKEVEDVNRGPITGRRESDMSAPGKTRIEVAKNELKRAISNLASSKEFSIIFFNTATKVWRTDMVRATPQMKEEARETIDTVVASASTYTLGALREAFSIAGAIEKPGTTRRDGARVDTVFLLSDGGPTDNSTEDPQPMDPDEILDQVDEWNKRAGVKIHTIAVDTDENGTYFLKQLAARNGGMFVERRR